MSQYAADFRGHYPSSWGDLYLDGLNVTPQTFVDPRFTTQPPPASASRADQAAWIDASTDYFFLTPGQSASKLGAADLLAYENPANVPGGLLLLFGDGHVEFREFPYAYDTLARQAPPSIASSSADATDTAPTITLRFSENVSATLTASALTLATLADPSTPIATATAVTYDLATQTATFTFPALPPGLYRATLPASSALDTTSKPLRTDATLDFAFVPAGQTLSAASFPNPVRVQSLALGRGATFDLADHSLILDYAPAGPSPLATIHDLLAAAYAARWQSPGLTSSPAAARALHQQSGPITTLALSESSQYKQRNNTTTFDGLTVDDTALLIKYTYAADATLDGKVGDTDVDTLYAHYQDSRRPQTYTPFYTNRAFTDADFTYDGKVDDRDVDLLSSTYDPLAPAL